MHTGDPTLTVWPVGVKAPGGGVAFENDDRVRVLIAGDQVAAGRIDLKTARRLPWVGTLSTVVKVPFRESIL